jgi:CheY-like chemotaxis protein
MVALVVDDEALVRRAIIRELAPAFTIIEADSYDQALVLLGERGPDLAAVVTDLDLGVGAGDGLAILAAVRGRLPACARLLVTGSSAAQFGTLAAPDAEAVIVKPWRSGDVLAAVQTVRASRQAEASAPHAKGGQHVR